VQLDADSSESRSFQPAVVWNDVVSMDFDSTERFVYWVEHQPSTSALRQEVVHTVALVLQFAHSLLLAVTSTLAAFNLLLPLRSDPAANAPRFLPEVGAVLIIYLDIYL